MQFKLDECLDVRLVSLFEEAGLQADTVRGEGLSGVADEHVYKHCVAERIVILTQDMHFSNPFRFPPRPELGIIVLRNPSQLLSDAAVLVRCVLRELRARSPAGQLWVVGRRGIRIWPSDETG